MRPVLYSYFRSSCSYRVRIALNLKKIDYEYRPVPLLLQKQKEKDYLFLNPKGEVPCFIDHDFVISQSMAIIHYLDKKVPKPSLFPEDAKMTALCLQICEVIGSGIQPLQNIGVLSHLTQEFSLSPTQKNNWIVHWISEGFKALEKMLSKCSGTYCIGENLSVADLFLIPQVYNAKRFNVDMKDFTNICKIETHCLNLAAFKNASPANSPDAPR